jgi:DNA (cytosine-5)-methyltransferase 1
MHMAKPILIADLFCGAGGTSTGVTQACESAGRKVKLIAVNHWDRAIETHAANHPSARHFCESLTTLNPLRAVPEGKLDLLVASPECTHHSNARGGKPVEEQSRSSAWCIVRWATDLRIKHILIENVPEFQSWGPIGEDGKPLKSKRGKYFTAFITTLESMEYTVDWRVLNTANFGDPTTRERLFIQAAKRGSSVIRWPEPTHTRKVERNGLIADTRKLWRSASEIIDWTLAGNLVEGRKKPLTDKTMGLIRKGLERFGGKSFLIPYYGHTEPTSLNLPLPTITTKDRFALVESKNGIRLRMLRPHELSAGMSFPQEYIITGSKTEQVKQIGNAVPVGTARALCSSILQAN